MNLGQLEDSIWQRHSNPKSGWSRVIVMPLFLYAIYGRHWKLLVGTIGFAVLNPFVFAPPATHEAWMSRVVLAERWWTRTKEEPVIGFSYPNVLNLLNGIVTTYALVAAYRRLCRGTVLAGGLSMGLKFWYVGELVRRYDATHSALHDD